MEVEDESVEAFKKLATIRDWQIDVNQWVIKCFGVRYLVNKQERMFRFYEEATEAIQSGGMTREEAHRMVDVVFDKPVEPAIDTEISGTLFTLLAFATSFEIDMQDAMRNCWQKTWNSMEKIRAKNLTKPMRGEGL